MVVVEGYRVEIGLPVPVAIPDMDDGIDQGGKTHLRKIP